MFNGNNTGKKPYSQVPLDEFSDDSSNEGDDDFVQRSMRNQRVRNYYTRRHRFVCVSLRLCVYLCVALQCWHPVAFPLSGFNPLEVKKTRVSL